VYRVSELLQQLLGEELGDGGDVRPSALIALERGLVGAVKYEDGVYREGDEAQEAIVECAQGRIGAAWSSQYGTEARL
jgi:hypothetical protein